MLIFNVAMGLVRLYIPANITFYVFFVVVVVVLIRSFDKHDNVTHQLYNPRHQSNNSCLFQSIIFKDGDDAPPM